MLRKILFIFITALFTCSALELEIAEAEQTFFDAYDTYIPSKPTVVKKIKVSNSKVKKFKLIKKAEFKNGLLCFNFSFKANLKPSGITYSRFLVPHPPYTILLRKSELRI